MTKQTVDRAHCVETCETIPNRCLRVVQYISLYYNLKDHFKCVSKVDRVVFSTTLFIYIISLYIYIYESVYSPKCFANIKPKNYLRQQALQTFHLILAGAQFTAGQLEERGAQLEQQHMRQTVLVDEQNALYRPAHADSIEFVAHALETCRNGRIFFEKRFLGAEGVVGQWVPGNNGISMKKWLLF